MENSPHLAAVIVSFHPHLGSLEKMLAALRPDVQTLILVDNGSGPDVRQWAATQERLYFLPLHENKGLATAQNEGLRYAKTKGADYVILFDQDSLPPSNMVRVLLKELQEKEAEGVKVAAIGPHYQDARQGEASTFTRFRGLWRERPLPGKEGDVIPVDYVVSSGCLMPMKTIEAVGGLRDELFIDYVDIEWCLRAAHKGYCSFGSFSVILPHCLGDAPASFLGKSVTQHSPLRHYYLARNRVWLYRQRWVPFHIKLVDGFLLGLRYAFHSLLTPPRKQHFLLMTKGIRDGLYGKMGRYEGRF